MLDLAILGLLADEDLHGYEIRKQLRARLGFLVNVSFGSIYPALSRLEATGAVVAVEPPDPEALGPAPPPVPPTGSLSGEWAAFRARRHGVGRGRARRSRKVYRITPSGLELFAELLAGAGGDDARSFGLRLAFARHLPPQARLSLLQRRRAQLVERLAEVRRAVDGDDLDRYARTVVEHTAEGIERDIGWVDRLMEGETHVEQSKKGPAATPERVAAGHGRDRRTSQGRRSL